MAAAKNDLGSAPYWMMVTFEIAPEDETEFNDIYDNDHIPNILQVEGVIEVVRFRDAAPSPNGWLVYSAIYFFSRENLHESVEWRAHSDLGRWAPIMRPKLKSRARRAGPVVARFTRN